MISWQLVLDAVVAVGLPGLILFYVRDRRQNRAETAVAEGTVQDKIDLSSITAVEAHVGLVEKAFEAERASMARQIRDLRAELAETQDERAAAKAELATMRIELERLRAQVDTLSDELQVASLRIQALIGAEHT